jgi:predicted TIM-barrel fold metal-dependent hydrolase
MMMRKTLFFIGTCFFLLYTNAIALEKNEEIKVFEAKIRGMLQKGTLPIIDVEYHHGGNIEMEKLIAAMDKNGVALTWLGPNEKLGSEESLKQNEKYPDKFVPTTVHGDGTLWHSSDKGFLEKLAKDVKTGKYFAMGEFEARHYPGSHNSRDIHMPVDSYAMESVFLLSSDTGVPFLLHHEAEDEMLPELERMLTKYPKAKVVWCHAGRNRNPKTWKRFMKVETVEEFLKKYPNLYFDLVQAPPGSRFSYTGAVDAIMYDTDRAAKLRSEWKNLFEAFPDRFVIGSDINTGRYPDYDRVYDTFRSIVFKALRKDVAEKVAFKNAWKLMTGEAWKD